MVDDLARRKEGRTMDVRGIGERFRELEPQCPFCTGTTWYEPEPRGDLKPVAVIELGTGEALEVAPMICKNCGFLLLHVGFDWPPPIPPD
jgi:hypothetical protein